MTVLRRTLCLLALFATSLPAQSRKPLTQDTYDLWRSIQAPTLSADGRWAIYTLTPTLGDGQVVVRSTGGSTEYRAARGWTGRPLASVTGAPFSPDAAQFTGDAKYALFLQYPSKATADSARARRARPADQPRNALGIMDLSSGAVTSIARVRGFRIARDGGRFAAYQIDADTTAAAGAGGGARGAGAAAAARPDSARGPAPRRRDTGAPLVLRELATGTETRIEGVTNYLMDEKERWLAYSVSSRDSTKPDGVFVRELASGTTTALKTGLGNYRTLAMDEAATQLAFVTDADEWTKEKPRFTLYHSALVAPKGKSGPQPALPLVLPDAVGAEFRIADRGRVEFVKQGGVLTFGVAPVLPDSIPADSLADKAVLDLWHWQDRRPQPMQRLQLGQERNRSFTAVVHLGTRQMRRVANDSMPNLQLSEDGRTALAVTSVPYELDALSGEGGNDLILINTVTGVQKKLAERVRFPGQLSPSAKFVLWFANGSWQAHENATGRVRALTAGITNISFTQETWDTPGEPAPWGLAGWSNGDARVLVYDRYDVWELDPLGVVAPKNLTDGVGRRDSLTFRVINLDPESRSLDPSQPLLLRTFDMRTKFAGVSRDRIGGTTAPERIVMAPKSWPLVQKARKADQLLVTRADYREYPNLWTGRSFESLAQISDAMPEQAQYSWGDVEMVKWHNIDGVPMEGLLYKPEGFDPSKKYPMVVYYYEEHSNDLYNYLRPAGRNVVNAPVYTSLGYLVFMPNIHYTPGYPGPSAVKSIVPGVQSLIARGIVDPAKIGITGQSWGGYQTAYVITQTKLFAAAVPNATVVNMTSAYGGIRWESGVERAIVNYERGQSRIGGSIWEYPERYMENSPLFYLDRVTTPVLFMANDADGAVPWYQGIEFFVAMRRLGKEAYMVNYNGDAHNPRKYANQKDIDRRMQEFFGNKLLGAPMPEWMKSGIPAIEKGRGR